MMNILESELSQKSSILYDLINECCVLCDFSQMESDDILKDEIEYKSYYLSVLLKYVQGTNEQFSEEFFTQMIKMISINIFRSLPLIEGYPLLCLI